MSEMSISYFDEYLQEQLKQQEKELNEQFEKELNQIKTKIAYLESLLEKNHIDYPKEI